MLVADARFESANWSSIAVGPPPGGAAIGLFGPVTTVVADASSYLLSALGITAMRGRDGTSVRQLGQVVQRVGEMLRAERRELTCGSHNGENDHVDLPGSLPVHRTPDG